MPAGGWTRVALVWASSQEPLDGWGSSKECKRKEFDRESDGGEKESRIRIRGMESGEANAQMDVPPRDNRL